MIYYLSKVVISALLIVAISEISKRSSLLGALLASIPLVSVMAILWIYIDTKDIEKNQPTFYKYFLAGAALVSFVYRTTLVTQTGC